jgi:hypothetical protein
VANRNTIETLEGVEMKMITLTTEQVIAPFQKIITDTHIVVLDKNERDGWLTWDVYTRNPLKGIGGGSSPDLESLLNTISKVHHVEIKH